MTGPTDSDGDRRDYLLAALEYGVSPLVGGWTKEDVVPHDPWMCAGCGQRFPVPSMARDHEGRHSRPTGLAPLSPDCAHGNKHAACVGQAWDDEHDRLTGCTCDCHSKGAA